MGSAIIWGVIAIVMFLLGCGWAYYDYSRYQTYYASSLLIIITGLIMIVISLHEAGVY